MHVIFTKARLLLGSVGVISALALAPTTTLAYQINGPSESVILGAETVCTNNLTTNPWSWGVSEMSGPMIRFPNSSFPPYKTARRWYYVQQSTDGGKNWTLLFQGVSPVATITTTSVASGTPMFQFQPFSSPVYFSSAPSLIKVQAWDWFAVYDLNGNLKWQSPAWVPHDVYRTDLFYPTTDLFDFSHGIRHYPGTCQLGNH